MMEVINKIQDAVNKKEIEDRDRTIENMRWTIIEFSNAIRLNRQYDSEAYNHILEIYDEYEEILRANNMENGRVTIAMDIIKEKYERGMRDGFPI